MGCSGAPDPKPDAEEEPKRPPVNPGPRDPTGAGSSEESQTSKPAADEEDEKVKVVVTAADSETKVVTLVMVIVPLALVLCILVLIYAILRTLQNKEPPRALVHCKRSLQDWV